jgi:hypothetical protein
MTDRIAEMIDAYRRAREGLAFLDSNLWLGRPRSPEFAAGFDLAALRRRLARYGIAGGVVSHFAAITYAPDWANARLLSELAGTGLWSAITLVPEMFWPEEAGRAYVAGAIERGARLARVFPATHNFTLRPWAGAALLQTLSDHRLPLVLWHTEASWEDIRSVCESYPELPVIVEGTGKKIFYHTRTYYPLMERCPNLRLELHNVVNYLGVEDLVQRAGAGRLIFGSYVPVYDPNATIMQVTHARIPDADKSRIARQNLAELIAGVRTP